MLTGRGPQSWQSSHGQHAKYSAPAPPSSQSPSKASGLTTGRHQACGQHEVSMCGPRTHPGNIQGALKQCRLCVCSFNAERAYTSSGRHSPEQTVGVAVAAAREAASACTCGGRLWAPRDRGRQPSGSPRAEAACLVDMVNWQGGALPQHPGLCAHACTKRDRRAVQGVQPGASSGPSNIKHGSKRNLVFPILTRPSP